MKACVNREGENIVIHPTYGAQEVEFDEVYEGILTNGTPLLIASFNRSSDDTSVALYIDEERVSRIDFTDEDLFLEAVKKSFINFENLKQSNTVIFQQKGIFESCGLLFRDADDQLAFARTHLSTAQLIPVSFQELNNDLEQKL